MTEGVCWRLFQGLLAYSLLTLSRSFGVCVVDVFVLLCFQFTTSPNTLMEPETPLDYEKYLEEHQSTINGDPLRDMLLFPDDDVQVTLVKRQFKTTEIPVPAAAR